jgi:TusA-related sulfurtransferase
MANRAEKSDENVPDFVLDITGEVCPLTFVRTKLLIERMASGQTADILLRGREPLENVPRAVIAQGHAVLSLGPVTDADSNLDVYRLRVRKAAPDGSSAVRASRA